MASSPQNIDSLPWQARGALSPSETARVMGVSSSHVYRMVDAGRLKAVQFGDRRICIPVAEICRLLNEAKPRRSSPRAQTHPQEAP